MLSTLIFFTVLYCVIAEVLHKVLPVPAKILKLESKEERTKAFDRYISCFLSTFHGSVCSLLSILYSLIFGLSFGQPNHDRYIAPLCVSPC
jgi:hypothetical protein